MPLRCKQSGFSLIEVIIAMTILVLVATTAVASLRTGVATLGATANSATAIDAIREYSEFTYQFSVTQLDALDGTETAPVLGNGEPLPGAGDMLLAINVQAVEDLDPETIVANPLDSLTRIVTVTATAQGQQILQAAWLVADQ